ncbi:site-specific integrase [Paludibacter jiangxiensis]|uniref:Site-specific recombinase XerD n=1 Tax=Paludibacter jiangxiensis TaxID=681398 RepID=A0A171A8X3_9BACT|nr:site-specific integrase [Paludibacter jiangxiensis]GAT63403.1 site-specific recombinase XerD [Paludibacter jiangxiensis]
MATVKAFIRTSTKKTEKVNVRFRLSAGRGVQLFYKAKDIMIEPDQWDSKGESIKTRSVFMYSDTEKAEFKAKITKRKTLIEKIYNEVKFKEDYTSNDLELDIDKALNPEKYAPITKQESFFDIFEEFLLKHPMSDVRKKNFRVVVRALQRYELYEQIENRNANFTLSLDAVSPDDLRNFTEFLRGEFIICETHPEIYEQVSESRKPKSRGQNTINGVLAKLRTFFIWCADNEKTSNNPFRKFTVEECVYGTPYYISIEERNQLYYTDLSNRPDLEVQRDIFVFQCLIGCRISDLNRLSKQNVINGAIEYIARKTRDNRPVTVRVPLNKIANEILAKYNNFQGESLLPFSYEQEYNIAIKEAFTIAKLTRSVMILNPLTRESEMRPLNEIASSHLARRTFIGNLYKQVKDPNLVGSLSGHKEGSKAFSRYRDIDEEMKKDLVNLLV